MKSLWNWILQFIKQKPQPAPTPINPDEPYSVAVAGSVVKWKDLRETCKIISGVLDARGFSANYTGQEKWSSYDGHTSGWICMTWKHNGVAQGEYWDGMAWKSPYLYVSLFHITDPSSPFANRMPVKGQRVGMFFVDESKSQRSNIAWGEWPL